MFYSRYRVVEWIKSENSLSRLENKRKIVKMQWEINLQILWAYDEDPKKIQVWKFYHEILGLGCNKKMELQNY